MLLFSLPSSLYTVSCIRVSRLSSTCSLLVRAGKSIHACTWPAASENSSARCPPGLHKNIPCIKVFANSVLLILFYCFFVWLFGCLFFWERASFPFFLFWNNVQYFVWKQSNFHMPQQNNKKDMWDVFLYERSLLYLYWQCCDATCEIGMICQSYSPRQLNLPLTNTKAEISRLHLSNCDMKNLSMFYVSDKYDKQKYTI